MNPAFTGKITLLFLLLVPGEALLAQTSLKFESGGGPAGSGPSAADQVVTMYYGDGAVYSPGTTVTYSLSDQAYTSIEGSATTPGVVFGADNNGSSNALTGRNYYGPMDQVGGSTNAHYSLDGAIPAINVANDYAINIMVYSDALITSSGSNIMPTSTKNIYFAKLTLTFSRPVSNPIIHFTGMGGFYRASGSSGTLGLAAGVKLNEDYPITKLAGNTFFQVSDADKRIYNSADRYTSNTNSTSPSGASGSVKITGSNITTLTFDVLMNGDGSGSSNWSATNRVNGDVFLVSASFSAYGITGTVHNDNNGGVPDGPGYEGATVTLRDSEGFVVATTTTDADGNYSFSDIVSGDYTVEFTAPEGFEIVGASDGDTDGITAISLTENISGIDFGINEPPVATDDLLSGVAPGSPATVNILDNDSDPNGGALSPDDISLVAPGGATDILTDAEGDITGFTVPGEGTWLLNDDGTLTFTPEDGFTGDPTPVQYTVRDAAGLTSDPATVTITYDEPLPVDLVSFTVAMDGCQPVLTWTTATEKDFDRFEIERSYNGRDFSMLAKVPATGSNSSYVYHDEIAVDGNNFYRLKMVDKDGSYSYSTMVKAFVTCNTADVKVYPNPSDGFIRISGLKGGEHISITDMSGRSIRMFELNDVDQPIDIGDLAQGVYNIIITDNVNNRQVVQRLVKR